MCLTCSFVRFLRQCFVTSDLLFMFRLLVLDTLLKESWENKNDPLTS